MVWYSIVWYGVVCYGVVLLIIVRHDMVCYGKHVKISYSIVSYYVA